MIFRLAEKLYEIRNPSDLSTPGLIVFHHKVDENIQIMNKILKAINPSADLDLLCPHVKTHKSIWVTRKLRKAGVEFFKASLNEINMLVAAGVKKIFIAYPMLGEHVNQFITCANQHKDIEWYILFSHQEHVNACIEAIEKNDLVLNYFIDLDVGMHRTGIKPEAIVRFYQTIPNTNRLKFAGIHAYDGHNHIREEKKRKNQSIESMKMVLYALDQCQQKGIEVKSIIVAGTPTFREDYDFLYSKGLNTRIWLSPGTWIYFDSTTRKIMDCFELAALVICRVIDQTGENYITVNVGHKRWSIDQGVPEMWSLPDVKVIQYSEEHTVLQLNNRANVNVGDYILLSPMHVCSTVNLWETFRVIDEYGYIDSRIYSIEGRNR